MTNGHRRVCPKCFHKVGTRTLKRNVVEDEYVRRIVEHYIEGERCEGGGIIVNHMGRPVDA